MKRFLLTCLVWSGAAFGQGLPNNPVNPTPASIGAAPATDSRFNQPVPVTFRSGIIPSLHLAKLGASATPTVCIAGDSTSTVTPATTLVPIDDLWYGLTRRVREDNPTKTITFANYAVGAQTWNTLDGIATANQPAWYFNTALPWLPYVQAANCTTLFLNMGVNDANGIVGTHIRSVLAKIAAWGTAPASWAASTAYALGAVIKDTNGKLEVVSVAGTSGTTQPTWPSAVAATTTDGSVSWQLLSAAAYTATIPDLVLITNINTSVASGLAPYNTTANQIGTVAAASYDRALALSNAYGWAITGLTPLGLIDIGRYFTMAFNGYDPVNQFFTQNISTAISNITTWPYTLPSTAGDFDLTTSFTAPSAQAFSASNPIQIFTSSAGNTSTNTSVIVTPATTGSVSVKISNASGVVDPAIKTLAGAWTTTANAVNTIEVTVKGEHLYVAINGTVAEDVLTQLYQAPFTPSVALATPPSGASMTVSSYNSASVYSYNATVPNPVNCYGVYAGGVSFGSGPNGGNGINHVASACQNLVYKTILDATRFAP